MHVHPTALDPTPYLVLDLGRGLTRIRLGAAGVAGGAAGGRLPSKLGPSMPATSGPPVVDPATAGLGAGG